MNGLFLVTTDADWEKRVRAAFQGTASGELRPWSDGVFEYDQESTISDIKAAKPQVVLVGPGVAEAFTLGLAKKMDEECPEICTVLVAPYEPLLFQNAMRAGFRDILDPRHQQRRNP